MATSGKGNSKPRILLLLHELSLSGAPKLALNVFSELSQHFEVHILSLCDGPLRAQAERIGEVKTLLDFPLRFPFPGILEAQSRLSRARGAMLRLNGQLLSRSAWWRDFQPDLIYANSVISLYLTRYLDWWPHAPKLLHVHELKTFIAPFEARFPRLIRDWPHSTLTCSEAAAEYIKNNCGVAAHNISVVTSFIDAPDLMSVPSLPGGTRFLVGNAGGTDARKGPDLWLHTAQELSKRHAGARFRWVGWRDDASGRACRNLCHELGLDQRVEWLAPTPNPLPLLAACDAGCISSREEPASMVTLEFMALQKPVVCFALSGGPPELIGKTGMAVSDFSPPQMADALWKLSQNPAQREQLGRAARERVLANFTGAVQIPKIRALIDKEIAGKHLDS